MTEKLGNSFGGEVEFLSSDKIASFWEERNNIGILESGERSISQSLGIPFSFMKTQPSSIQKDLVIANSHKAPPGLYLLKERGKVVFASKTTPHGWESPEDKFNFNGSSRVWKMIRTDYGRGLMKFITVEKFELSSDYQPAVFVTVPIFYGTSSVVSTGLFKLRCTNGLFDTKSVGEVKFASYDADKFLNVLGICLETQKVATPIYEKSLESLKKEKLSLTYKEELLKLLDDRLVSKTLIDRVSRHIDMVRASKEVPENSPEEVDSYYDLMDTFTFYTKSLPSITSQCKSEKNLFDIYMVGKGGFSNKRRIVAEQDVAVSEDLVEVQ